MNCPESNMLSAVHGASANKRGRPLDAATLRIREAILELANRYEVITVRGAYYQLVTAGVVPKDETRGYRRVQRQMLLLRHQGELPWEFVADATRWMRKPTTWDALADAAHVMAETYRRNLWQSQRLRIEVWLEKEALAGVISDTTSDWDVALMPTRGIASASFLHTAAAAANEADIHGIRTVLLLLFDFDAGGARAVRTIRTYFDDLCQAEWEIVPLAVNEQQILDWSLPTRAAKKTDPEAHKWGEHAVELDAIPPDRLNRLVHDAITSRIDPHAWRLEQIIEREEREKWKRLVERDFGNGL